MEPIVVSVYEAAKALNLGRTSIHKLMKSGELESVKLGSRRLIKADSVRRLIDNAK